MSLRGHSMSVEADAVWEPLTRSHAVPAQAMRETVQEAPQAIGAQGEPATGLFGGAHSGTRSGVLSASRRGRPAGEVMSLDAAAALIARLASLDEARVGERLRAAPFSFFPHARGSGERLRIPERDVWALLGREELMTPGEVADALRFCAKTINRRLLRGEIPHVVVFGERRIRRADFLALQLDGRGASPRRGFSFSRRKEDGA